MLNKNNGPAVGRHIQSKARGLIQAGDENSLARRKFEEFYIWLGGCLLEEINAVTHKRPDLRVPAFRLIQDVSFLAAIQSDFPYA